MHGALAVVILFSVATAVALAARRVNVPYTVALVIAGLALGPTRWIEPPALGQDLLYSLFLPGLLFEAAYHLKFGELRQSPLRLLLLAVPGVVVGAVVTAGLLVAGGERVATDALPFRYAMVFGAIVAATDPIAVVALFKALGAPRALVVLVEGESLLNDGSAVVLVSVLMMVVGGSGGATWSTAAAMFLRVVSLGVAVGAGFGLASSLLMKRVDDPMIEITITLIAAYGSFTLAERLHGSGVLATVTAGVFTGSYAAEMAMSPATKSAVVAFWAYVAFALNSIVFLLVGFSVSLRGLLVAWRPILIAYLASLVARALLVSVVALLLHRTRERIPWSWGALISWGGLRGALSMVLALSLPPPFPYRDLIVTMTFGVVLLSLLVQGLSIARLVRLLQL